MISTLVATSNNYGGAHALFWMMISESLCFQEVEDYFCMFFVMSSYFPHYATIFVLFIPEVPKGHWRCVVA
jgi:hypothetical protein